MEPVIPFEPVRKDEIPAGDWISQVKWDGVRVLTYWDGNQVRLFNRKKNERTQNYPELLDIATFCAAESVILDGEVIALGPDGKPSFHEVMRRDGIRRYDRVPFMEKQVPVTYMIFDVLFYNGKWMLKHPLNERIDLLDKIVDPTEHVQLVSSHEDPETLFSVIEKQGMEGIVMKKPDSAYLIGEKKDIWVKVKNYKDLIAAIGGFTLNGDVVNAILLGLFDQEDRFYYIGHTGTGKLTSDEWRALTERLSPLVIKDRPFVNHPERQRDTFWVKPKVTVKIQFAEWTPGHVLRQPSIQSFVQIPVHECTFEPNA